MCVSKVQHMTGQKTGCNQSRPVFFSVLIFQQTLQLTTEKFQNLCNCNRWSGLLQLGSVQFRSFLQSSKLDLRTLAPSMVSFTICILFQFNHEFVKGQAATGNQSLAIDPTLLTSPDDTSFLSTNHSVLCHCHHRSPFFNSSQSHTPNSSLP